MKKVLYIFLFALTLLIACGQEKEEVTISVAASLTDAMTDIIEQFEAENPNYTVAVNAGGSGALSQQIIQGAPADIFFSASLHDFKRVYQEGLIDDDYKIPLLANELVWIQQADTELASEIDNFEQIAIGTPEAVPAGDYAKQALTGQGIYEALEGRFVFTKDVRQVMQYVEKGDVHAGLVYRTDALTSDKVQINEHLPIGTHDAIIYPVGIINNKPAVEAFYQYLLTEEAANIFEQYGFGKVDGDIDGSIFSTN
ncbi:molybdate ABC transporter substrate-binding protein [Gracilibacillus sp. S3-1-1]|uniref:Molybdate ABC transporter substrate-binding protein n=1 Tax=Gracilibacillus pellucidus TaxID=3095368 RepID=A0ACC6M7I9_9BACI|nr:molybdate ABC transporter substrate-binding protein [Gracilibacillus sp. S3-1-1]MDX8046802.1 molybdate ABC transporter substrate-binding protein [Gracilibacillus sp. S3-1-1]